MAKSKIMMLFALGFLTVSQNATARVNCGFNKHCPDKFICCRIGGYVWCCPNSEKCDLNIDEDWTGCTGGVYGIEVKFKKFRPPRDSIIPAYSPKSTTWIRQPKCLQ